MLIKLLGGILVIVSSGLLGIAMANRYSGRPKDIRKLRTSLQMLETEILYGATPLPQACESVAAKLEGNWNCFYRQISEELQSGKCCSLKEAWVNAVNNALIDTSLSNADRELLVSFGNILGSSDREDQEKHFKLFYKQLELNETNAEEERKKNEKMYRSLGFLFGVLIFVILI